MSTGNLTEAATKKLREEIARDRLHTPGTGHLPLDQERARIELTDEERVRRGARPKTRRWRGLAKIDGEVDKLTNRHAEALASLARAEDLLRQTPEEDARVLADWLAAGERGDRPTATLYERTRERDAAGLLVDAVAVELDKLLSRRLAYVERHRGKMLRDACSDVDAARARMLELVHTLPELRANLISARETLIWVASYPALAETFGITSALALGLLGPVERTLGTRARVDYGSLLAALEEDANALAEAHAEPVKQKLGTAGRRTPVKQAMWESDPDMVQWKKDELERARQLAEFGNVQQLAREVRE